MPSGLPARAPRRDCVQNQTARAAKVMRIRSASGFQRAAGAASGTISGAISGEFIAKFLDAAQIKFAGAEIRHGFDAAKLIGARLPEGGKIGFPKLGQALAQLVVAKGVQNDEAFAFFFVRNGGDDEDLFGSGGNFLQFVFDFDVRNHFAADLAEAAHAIGDADEAVFVDGGDVAGVIPAVAQDFGGFFGLVQVALHDVGAADQQQTGLIGGLDVLRFGIDDAQNNSGQGMADAAAFGTD